MKKRDKLWQLFSSFFRIGAFTFGGGYAMIPLIQREVVEEKKWLEDDDILEIIAIAESTPGPIAINSATFVGYRVAGVLGAFCATFGVVLPSLVIISILSYVVDAFKSNVYVSYAFWGIRAGVLALVTKALWTMFKKQPKKVFSYAIMFAAFACVAFFHVNTILVLVICAVVGLSYSIIADRKAGKS